MTYLLRGIKYSQPSMYTLTHTHNFTSLFFFCCCCYNNNNSTGLILYVEWSFMWVHHILQKEKEIYMLSNKSQDMRFKLVSTTNHHLVSVNIDYGMKLLLVNLICTFT